MEKDELWPAQARQDQVPTEIIVEGVEDWKELFAPTLTIKEAFGTLKEGDEVSMIEALKEEARLNDVSIERTILSMLVEKGYVLEELEVEFDGAEEREKWGRCTWYKEHDSYTNPSEKHRNHFPDATPLSLSYIVSQFKTEHCGDQEFTLISMQMIGAYILRMRAPESKFPVSFLFHKTLVFRRAVLSLPKQQQAA